MPPKTKSPLDTLEDAFNVLVAEPSPLALEGAALGPDLPARRLPLDELRTFLLEPSISYETRDRAMAELLRRAKAEPAWLIGLGGVLLPGLRRIAGRVAKGYPGRTADLDAELLAGFVEAVQVTEPSGSRLASRLLTIPWTRAKAVRRVEVAWVHHKERSNSSTVPQRPWSHPDFVLARAVTAGVLTDEESELIGETRVGGARLGDLAASWRIPYERLRRRRYRAECRLVRWLSNGSSGVPKRPSGRHFQLQAGIEAAPASRRCAVAHETKEVRAPRPGRRPDRRPAQPAPEHERSRP